MHRWCLHGPIDSYHSFWWSNLICCLYNIDTLNICIKEFGSENIILIKWHLLELSIFFWYKLWYIELLGVNNFVYLILSKCFRLQALRSFAQILLKSCFHRFYWNLFFKNGVCWFELLLGKKTLAKTKFFHWLLLCGGVSNKHCLLTFFIYLGLCCWLCLGLDLIVIIMTICCRASR